MKLITLSQMKTKRQKISIIGIKGLPASYGGFETLADNLCKYLFNEFDFLVYCSLCIKFAKIVFSIVCIYILIFSYER